jgi:hypothetical protein
MTLKIKKEKEQELFRVTKWFYSIYGGIIGGFVAILLVSFLNDHHIHNYFNVAFCIWLGASIIIFGIWTRVMYLKKIIFKRLQKHKQ